MNPARSSSISTVPEHVWKMLNDASLMVETCFLYFYFVKSKFRLSEQNIWTSRRGGDEGSNGCWYVVTTQSSRIWNQKNDVSFAVASGGQMSGGGCNCNSRENRNRPIAAWQDTVQFCSDSFVRSLHSQQPLRTVGQCDLYSPFFQTRRQLSRFECKMWRREPRAAAKIHVTKLQSKICVVDDSHICLGI